MRRHARTLPIAVVVTIVTASGGAVSGHVQSPAATSRTCASLASLAAPNTTITVAQSVGAGAFTSPTAFPEAARLPAFCRVGGIVRPSTDSEIKFEVWLPSDWNGKFMGVGNGGFAGSIPYRDMGEPLSRHYATAATDTGHEGAGFDVSWALGHREKLIDFGYRAVHEVTVRAKLIVNAYYGQPAKYSYWSGCSTGGRQGLASAQRFPADFDGIIAGAPANWLTHMTAAALWKIQEIDRKPESLVPPSKLVILHAAVLDACDAGDGVKDGLLEDPTRCTFDPGILECKAGVQPDCLTSSQVELVRTFYGPTVNPRTKQPIFPGYARGGELAWGDAAKNGHMVAKFRFGNDSPFFKYAIFQDPNWDNRSFDLDAGLQRADEIDGGLTKADPDLRPFFARGGKLLQYHGWSDPSIAPLNSIDYYNSVKQAVGASVNDSYRLFMVPGMEHCSGGDGPDTFDRIGALEKWVEQKRAPDRIVAAHMKAGTVDRTRPLCPYPQVAVYKGAGSTDAAENFSCRPR